MNFLAHAYLSFGYSDILIGNLITDFIRGNQKQSFSPDIQTGIALHYAIDEFTDKHPVTLKAKEYLRPVSGRYCSVFMDVVYDHFLACDDSYFSLSELAVFSQNTYSILKTNKSILPENFSRIFYYMETEDWLFSYHTTEGIRKTFNGIYHRAKYLKKSDATYSAFLQHYDQLQIAYDDFMPDIIRYAKSFLQKRGFS